MYNLIQDLARQAEGSKKHVPAVWQFYDHELEKFAKLVICECINRIEQNRSSGENTDSWTITRDMAFHQMKEDLKKHFGVE